MREIKNLMDVLSDEIVVIRYDDHGIKGEWYQDHILEAINDVTTGKAKAYVR